MLCRNRARVGPGEPEWQKKASTQASGEYGTLGFLLLGRAPRSRDCFRFASAVPSGEGCPWVVPSETIRCLERSQFFGKRAPQVTSDKAGRPIVPFVAVCRFVGSVGACTAAVFSALKRGVCVRYANTVAGGRARTSLPNVFAYSCVD